MQIPLHHGLHKGKAGSRATVYSQSYQARIILRGIILDILLISEFYYKHIWGNKGQVRLYIDKDGNLTRKPSAYYINTYEDHGDKTKDMIKEDILKRAKEHQHEYQIGYGTTSLTKYLEIMRRNTENWD